MKKFFIFLFGIVFGLVVVLGGAAGVGYWFVTQDGGVGKLTGAIPQIEFSEEVKNLSVLEYIDRVMSVASKFKTTSLGEIEDTLGVPISSTVAELLGIDNENIRKATFETLPNAVVDSLTIESLQTKFQIELPDMPLFQTEEFKTKPIVEAFKSLSEKLDPKVMTVADLETNFGIVLSDNPIFEDPAIKNTAVANLGAAINEMQLSSMLGVVYRTDVEKYNATHVKDETELAKWKEGKTSYRAWVESGAAGEGGFDYFDTAEEQAAYIAKYNAAEPKPALEMTEYWAYALEAEKTAIYQELYPDDQGGSGETGGTTEPQTAELPAPDGKIFAKPVCPTVLAEGAAAPKESSALIKKLSVHKLGAMTSEGGSDTVVNRIVENSTLGEIVEIKESDTILYSLKDSKISTLDADIKKVALKNIMTVDETSSAAMKFLVTEPMRDELNPWKKNDDGTYMTDENGKRIPNYLQATDENGDLLFEQDAEGNQVPVYVYATIDSIDAKIKQMVIGDILAEPAAGEKRNVILEKVTYSTLDSLDKDLTGAIDNTTIDELVSPAAGEEKAYILETLGKKKISELNGALNELTINDVIKAPEDPLTEHVILQKLRAKNEGKGVLISAIGTEIGTVVNDTTIGELVKTDENSSSILIALSGTKISDLDSAMKTLTLEQLVGADALYEKGGDGAVDRNRPKGVLGLIDYKNRDAQGNGTTTIENIGTNATNTIQTATLSELRLVGLLPKDDSLTSKAVDLMIETDQTNGTTTTLSTLPAAIINLMLNTKLGTLIDKGLVTVSGGSEQTLAVLKNLTIQGIIDGIANGTISPTVSLPAAA